MTIYRQYPHFKTEVLVASVRHTQHVIAGGQARRPCRDPAAQRAAPAVQAPADRQRPQGLPRRLGQDRPVDPVTAKASHGNDGTVTAPDGSGRQVKLITADDVVAYLKAHPDLLRRPCRACRAELALAPRVQGPGRDRHAAGDPEAPAQRDRQAQDRAHRDHRQLEAEPDRPEPHPGGGDQHHPGDDLREDDPCRDARAARAARRRLHHARHRGQCRRAQARAGARRLCAGAGRHRCRHRPGEACPPAQLDHRRGRLLRRRLALREVRRADAPAASRPTRPTASCASARAIREAFGPDMSTELLFFLAKVLENTIRAWLDLPE